MHAVRGKSRYADRPVLCRFFEWVCILHGFVRRYPKCFPGYQDDCFSFNRYLFSAGYHDGDFIKFGGLGRFRPPGRGNHMGNAEAFVLSTHQTKMLFYQFPIVSWYNEGMFLSIITFHRFSFLFYTHKYCWKSKVGSTIFYIMKIRYPNS